MNQKKNATIAHNHSPRFKELPFRHRSNAAASNHGTFTTANPCPSALGRASTSYCGSMSRPWAVNAQITPMSIAMITIAQTG